MPSFSNSICARECSPFSLFSERSGWPTNVWSLIAHSSVGGLDFFRFEAIPLSHASPYGLPIFRFPPVTPSGLLQLWRAWFCSSSGLPSCRSLSLSTGLALYTTLFSFTHALEKSVLCLSLKSLPCGSHLGETFSSFIFQYGMLDPL